MPLPPDAPRLWGAVPAAGVGRRMGGEIPKQYLELHGATVIEHSIGALLDHPQITRVAVALASDDLWWGDTTLANDTRVVPTAGGEERVWSVRNLLHTLLEHATPEEWVLVHDAARPCLRRADLDRLIAACRKHPVGGLLGMPVRDTMKRADGQCRVEHTVAREGLWHAFTPQMFRIGALLDAIEKGLERGVTITDEASAIEATGSRPLMVEGQPDNIKITRPGDLALAEFFLRSRIEQSD